MRFLHAADIHLGYEQYGCNERYNDFGRAFEALVDDALARQVDLVLLAGDLFHKYALDPQTLLQATHQLRRLREANVCVIAIEGNHERPRYQGVLSWLDYLAECNLLVLLSPDYQAGQMSLRHWDGQSGAYLDLSEGVRVIGVKYYGAMTPRVIQDLTAELGRLPGPRPDYTVLMLHAGLQGILDNYSATLTRAELDPLRAYTDYLALGHIHKPFIQDDWIYNPGSLETNSVAEVEWEDRGYFLVEVDPSRRPAHVVTKVCSKRRAFERLSFSVSEYDSPEALQRALAAYIGREATPDKAAQHPVVELELRGILNFDHADLDLAQIEQMVREAYTPITYLLRDITSPSEFSISTDEALSRAELERVVLRELVERDVRRRAQSERWADMVLSLKRLALGDSPPEEIVGELRRFADLLEGEQPC